MHRGLLMEEEGEVQRERGAYVSSLRGLLSSSLLNLVSKDCQSRRIKRSGAY